MGSAKPSPSASTTTSTKRRSRALLLGLALAAIASPAAARSCTVSWTEFLAELSTGGGAVELWGIRHDGVLTLVPTNEANCQIDVAAGRVSTSEGRDCRLLAGRTKNFAAGWRVTAIEATGGNWAFQPLDTGGFAMLLTGGLPPPYNVEIRTVTMASPAYANCDDRFGGWRRAFD